MTSYAVDEDNMLIRMWATGRGQRAGVVSRIPAAADPGKRLDVAAALTLLSEVLWRCYIHPVSPADRLEVNSEGWRRQQSREAFADVIPAIKKPNLPDEGGSLIIHYNPVEEYAHRVGRALHAIEDADLVEAVSVEVAAEIQAVESAERGELNGRAAQAVGLSRSDASPVQVITADGILKQNPLAGELLFLDLEPTAASVAVAHWLKAAADVVAEVSGMPATQVLLAADDIRALPVEAPSQVLKLFDVGSTAYRIVVGMVTDAMLVADGVVSGIGALLAQRDGQEDEADDQPTPIRLTPLDPRRPARDLLEDLLAGIYGCRLLYAEYRDAEGDDEQTSADDIFCAAVREEATANSARLM
jgi:hypothetical protein